MTCKICNNYRIRLLLFIIMAFCINVSKAQSNIDNVNNKYGLSVVNSVKLLQSQVKANPDMQMMDLKKAVPGIALDLRYATTNNFMHRKLYPPISTTYMRRPAAMALKKINDSLHTMHLGLKIFDAYRPYAITVLMWELIKDDRYVADPAKGSGHNRGIAADLTIIDVKTKKELPMGTGFDNFTDTAHVDFTALPENILHNRMLLKSIMEKFGFESFATEWWHFSLPNPTSYEPLNISFADMKKISH